jgi:hypothetical protein
VLFNWFAVRRPSSKPSIFYTPRQDTSSERELDALASIYKRAVDRYLEAQAAEGSDGQDAQKEEINVSDKKIIPK